MTAETLLSVNGVSKVFAPRFLALDRASLDVRKGEVHCLLGANGAGKSTFLKILAGALKPSDGEITINGTKAIPHSPSEAAALGISMIYQELDLVPQLTVEENMFLGHAPRRFGLLRKAERSRLARIALDRIGAGFATDVRVEALSVANQQLTAIARSLTRNAKIIIMDEPSAALNETELEAVFRVIRELTAQGVSILYVSHRLGELREIGDRVTVLRGGRTIGTFDVATTRDEMLVEAIIGKDRTLIERQERAPVTGDLALKVNHLQGPHGLSIDQLELRHGEVLGITGLNGSGRTTFLKALFGDVAFEGDVMLHGKPYHPRNPREAIKRGVGLVPENRKTEGLILDAAIYQNTTMPTLPEHLLARHRARKSRAVNALHSLSTKYRGPDQPVMQLSGGNQQKVVLSKWVSHRTDVLLLDEPSRGLDIGAKADLYALVDRLAQNEGAAVIVASSELDELYAACDTIWVFHEGRNIARFSPAQVDRDTILKATILGDGHVRH